MKATAYTGAALVGAVTLASAGWLAHAPDPAFETVTLARSDIESRVNAVGTLKPLAQVEIGARVSGQIERLHVKAGDRVEKGQLLVEIDPRIAQAAVNAARAEQADLEAQLAEQRAQRQRARQERERQRAMHADGATPRQALEAAEADWQVAEARVAQLQARIRKTASTLDGHETELGYTRVHAPFAGTVISLLAEQGQTLNATYQTPTLMRIADLSTMTVWTDVSEADVGRVRPGQAVSFTTLGGEGRRWAGVVRQILPAPEEPKGSEPGDTAAAAPEVVAYRVLFDVDNADGVLMPQMTAQVSFRVAHARDVLAAPLEALAPVAGEPGAYTARVLAADGRPVERRVRLGVRNRLAGEVLDGLAAGERLVLRERDEAPAPGRFQW